MKFEHNLSESSKQFLLQLVERLRQIKVEISVKVDLKSNESQDKIPSQSK
jgi:hypothetical protein